MLSALNTERVAQQDGGVGVDGELTQVAGGERVALLARDVAVDERVRGVRREVPRSAGFHSANSVDGAVVDVVTHLVRRAQTGQRDLALGVRGRQVARSSRDADRGRADDALEVRVGLQQRRGLVERRLVVVVAVDGVDQLDVRVVLGSRSVFISSIQAFWLVALAAAERIATSPASPICSAIMSTCALAMPSAAAWLMKRSRHSGSVSESKVTTLVPAVAGLVERVADRGRVVGRDAPAR